MIGQSLVDAGQLFVAGAQQFGKDRAETRISEVTLVNLLQAGCNEMSMTEKDVHEPLFGAVRLFGAVGRRRCGTDVVPRRSLGATFAGRLIQFPTKDVLVYSGDFGSTRNVQAKRDRVRCSTNGGEKPVQGHALPANISKPPAALEQLHLALKEVDGVSEFGLELLAPVLGDEGVRIFTVRQRDHVHLAPLTQQNVTGAK